MSAITEQKGKCKMCKKEIKFFSGLEHWAVMERSMITPLCEGCSEKVREFIEGKLMEESGTCLVKNCRNHPKPSEKIEELGDWGLEFNPGMGKKINQLVRAVNGLMGKK